MPIRSWHSSHRFFARIRNGHQLQPIEILWRRAKVIEPKQPGKRQEPLDYLKIGITAFSHLRFTEPDVIRRWSLEGKKNFLWNWGESLFRSSYFRLLWSWRENVKESKNSTSQIFCPFRALFSLKSKQPGPTMNRSTVPLKIKQFLWDGQILCLASKHS